MTAHAKHSTAVRRELAGGVQTGNCTLRCTRMRAVELAVGFTLPVAPTPAVAAVLVSVLRLLPAVEVTAGRGPPRRTRQHSHLRDSSYLGRRPTQKAPSALRPLAVLASGEPSSRVAAARLWTAVADLGLTS